MIREKYRKAIAAALSEWNGKKMVRGVDDCPLAIADIDMAVLGIDTAAGWRGKYSTVEEARALLGKAGLMGAIGRQARQFGWPRIATGMIGLAQDGDRGIARTLDGVSTVIRYCGFWVGRQDRGDIMACDDDVLRAWRVAPWVKG
jgi:hypothetical protein